MVNEKGLNREAWLQRMTDLMRPKFAEVHALIPARIRVSCGWPVAKGLSAKNRTIGQCWAPKASADNTAEIFISPWLGDDDMRIAGVLAHELVHAAVGNDAGHGPAFKRVATAIGLEGKMTATTEGEAFKAWVRPLLQEVGRFPGAKLDHTQRKKQSTRLHKASCPECGYTIRVTQKWIDVGLPTCCCGTEMEAVDPSGE